MTLWNAPVYHVFPVCTVRRGEGGGILFEEREICQHSQVTRGN